VADDALTFESLRIRRMRGFRPPGLRFDDFSPGINVVFGPNASGKSTVGRALHRLLWPESAGEREHLAGSFELEGDRWRVELEAGRAVYRRGDRDSAPPDLPPRDHNRRYHLYLEELLHATDQNFARRIQQAARGGYDIAEAAEALDFTDPSPRTGESTREVERLEERVERREAQLRQLRDDERRLEELRDDLRDARRARSELDLLRKLRTYFESRDDLQQAERRLANFPDVVKRIDGDERRRVEHREERIEEIRERIRDAERQRERSAERLRASPIPAAGLPSGLLGSLDARLRELRELQRELDRRTAALERAERAAESEWERIEGAVDRETARGLDLDDVGELADFARRAHRLDARREGLDWLDEKFGDAEPLGSGYLERLRDGLRHLQRWRSLGGRKTAGPTPRVRRAVALSAVALGATAAAAGTAIHPAWFGLLPVAGLLAYAAYRLHSGESTERRRSDHRRAFERLELKPPDEWTAGSVDRRIDELTRELAAEKFESLRAEAASEHAAERDRLAERERELEATRGELADRTGLAPETEPTAFRLFVDHLRTWQNADVEVEEIEAAAESLRERRDERLDEAAERIDPFVEAPADDIADLEGRLRTLRREHEDFRAAERRRKSAVETLETAREKLAAERNARDEIYEDLDLEPGDVSRLADLCSRRETYREARESYRSKRTRAEAERDTLEDHEAFDPALLELDSAELERRIRECRARADRADDLHEEVTRLENDLERARNAHDLEEALAEYREAREQLRRERREDYRRAVGAALAAHLRERTRHQQLPDVFHRAQNLFSSVTRGRFRLLFDEGDPPAFRARDEVLEREFPLEELSDGTRVQLLVAIRIAFLEAREEGFQLPVVLDETLATSDANRADALIDSIRRIASRGRQVFYLTAQRDEVVKWRTRLDGESVAHRVLRIEGAGDGRAARAVPRQPEPTDAVPDRLDRAPTPEGCSHREYGRALDVPAWHPREPVGRLHLWYVVERTELLRECLDAGLRRWGQLRHLGETGGLGAIDMDAPDFETVRARARAAANYRETWLVGRGKPVDRTALEESGAVTETFIDEVDELCERLDGEAEALLDALEAGEVSGFRTQKRRELRAHLRREGHLAETEPLDPDHVWERLLAASADALEAGLLDRSDLRALLDRLTGPPPRE